MKKKSYAKINLSLSVINKSKPKGFHELDMLNMSINLYDIISLKFKNDNKNEIKIVSNNENLPLDSNNSVYKTIEKFKKVFNLDFSCIVSINKKIPLESGLGGGSSNAAITLNMLDKHFKTKMSDIQKMNFIEEISTDGIYFIKGGIARVKGIGNKISKINGKFNYKILVVKPKTGCSTKEIYNSIDYKSIDRPNLNKVEEAILNKNFELLETHVGNSLTDAACYLNDDIKDTLNRLKSCKFDIVLMTGSGSTCFAISNKKAPYKFAKQIFNKKDYDLIGTYKIK